MQKFISRILLYINMTAIALERQNNIFKPNLLKIS